MAVTDHDEDLAAWSDSIFQAASEVLDRVVAGYEIAEVPLPARRFIQTGTPAHDCEQVVVTFRQAYYGPPGDEAAAPQHCDGPRSMNIEVHVVRCIPAPKGTRNWVPGAAEITEMARTQMKDAWLLLDLAPALESWNAMAPGGLGVIGTVETGEPQGAFQGMVLTLTMAIP